MGYERDTLVAYRDHSKAKSYKNQQTKNICWARFTTWRERLYAKKALKKCNLKSNDKVLDVPCGSGFLGVILNKYPASIIAADISSEMMNLAREDYKGTNFEGFIQADITKAPFKKGTFSCVITLGLMHRLPGDIRRQTLREISALSNKFIIVSYSIDSPYQRIKQLLITKIWPGYSSAPSPIPLGSIIKELNSNGLILRRIYYTMPFLSAEIIVLLEKRHQAALKIKG